MKAIDASSPSPRGQTPPPRRHRCWGTRLRRPRRSTASCGGCRPAIRLAIDCCRQRPAPWRLQGSRMRGAPSGAIGAGRWCPSRGPAGRGSPRGRPARSPLARRARAAAAAPRVHCTGCAPDALGRTSRNRCAPARASARGGTRAAGRGSAPSPALATWRRPRRVRCDARRYHPADKPLRGRPRASARFASWSTCRL